MSSGSTSVLSKIREQFWPLLFYPGLVIAGLGFIGLKAIPTSMRHLAWSLGAIVVGGVLVWASWWLNPRETDRAMEVELGSAVRDTQPPSSQDKR
jgi:hypothetical protein